MYNPWLRFFASAPLYYRRKTVELVSCYAFFKGWLLLSQPPSCLNSFTSLPTKQRLGTLSVGLGCFPFALGTCSPVLTPDQSTAHSEFGKSEYDFSPHLFSVSLPHRLLTIEAIPKYISGSTSYRQVRLAFHP